MSVGMPLHGRMTGLCNQAAILCTVHTCGDAPVCTASCNTGAAMHTNGWNMAVSSMTSLHVWRTAAIMLHGITWN